MVPELEGDTRGPTSASWYEALCLEAALVGSSLVVSFNVRLCSQALSLASGIVFLGWD